MTFSRSRKLSAQADTNNYIETKQCQQLQMNFCRLDEFDFEKKQKTKQNENM